MVFAALFWALLIVAIVRACVRHSFWRVNDEYRARRWAEHATRLSESWTVRED
jgi:hypothetical protein